MNDAPALAASSVGMAMGVAGSDVALETADVALMADDLSKAPVLIRLGRTAGCIIRQNIGVALAVKALALVAVIPGWPTLWRAVLGDMGASILVTLNGMRLLTLRTRAGAGPLRPTCPQRYEPGWGRAHEERSMPTAPVRSADPGRVLTIIMGGGQGTRLFPLTRERAKPAVPLAGKYRLVDIPISNSINSEMRRIFVLTQFLSASLHRHVYGSFKFDHFSGGFVEILAAEQSHTDTSWYQGTADAVRKNLVHFRNVDFDYALILSGDHLYRMDFRRLLDQHVTAEAEITLATIPVPREAASRFGIMQINAERRIVRYVEKPTKPALLHSLRLDRTSYAPLGIEDDRELFLGSMGIHLFDRDVLLQLLDSDLADFGRHIIPQAIERRRVFSHVFQGYWEDIGTIRSFYQANLDLVEELPRFNFFDMRAPIYTRARFLPPSKINGADIDHAIISEGVILNHCRVARSVVGLRAVVDTGSEVTRTILVGADYYEPAESLARGAAEGLPRIGIGRSTRIEGAIVDKNARIGDHCVISSAGKPDTLDHPLYHVRDGIVIIPKGAVIPHGTVI